MRGRERRAGAATQLLHTLQLAASIATLAFSLTVPAGELPDFSPQVSREGAVVVSITTVTLERRPTLEDDGDGEAGATFVERAPEAGERGAERRPVRGFASGVIVSAEGHILTSAHAVGRLREATIRLADGREFSGRLIGLDTVSDLALLKIEAGRLAVAAIGDPRALRVGDWVSAIGAPFGLESSVTAGIVSARRTLPGTNGIEMIQTDVAVNPGSSGSPLFNLHGQVVGINSMVYTTSGGYQGVSFALPIDAAMSVARQLREHGRVVRGQVGLDVQEMTPALALAFGLPRAAGAIVVSTVRGGPGERAGLRVGDIVLGVDERDDMRYADIQQAIADRAPGTSVRVGVWRSGTLRHVAIEVAELANASAPPPARPRRGDRLGLIVAEMSPRPVPGVDDAVLEVREAHGIALRAGLWAGDRILRVNDTVVRRLADYRAAIARAPFDSYVALLVLRDGRMRYFALGDPGNDS
ncbi:MAG: trypsin-like peptidase domain-containing protein [Caldimonas sp.]